MDIVSRERRSAMMSRIRGRDTKPELIVRKLTHALGYRFRLHRRDLPGTPDLVFPGRRKVIFVHGCFWHRHPGCRFAYEPKSRVDFWRAKFAGNSARDARVYEELKQAGWDVLTIWECETADSDQLKHTLKAFLDDDLR
jgi:DNA mismatch endonuclease (patch repair protein)